MSIYKANCYKESVHVMLKKINRKKRPKRRAKRNYTTRIVRSFLVAFMIIVLVPIFISTVFYGYILKIVSDNECEKTQLGLSQSIQNIDDDFRKINYIMKQMLESNILTSLINSNSYKDNPSVLIESEEFSKELNKLYIREGILYDMILYLKKPNILYSAHDSYCFICPYVFYSNFFKLENMTKEQWTKLLQESSKSYFVPMQTAIIEGYNGGFSEKRQIGMYVWPLYSNGFSCGKIIFLLDGNKFIDQMKMLIDIEKGSYAYIQTSDGKRIMSYSLEFNQNYDEKDILNVSMHSNYSNLEYKVVIPRSIIADKVSYLRHLIVFITAFLVSIGIIFTMLFARKYGIPLDRISQNVSYLFALDYAQPLPGCNNSTDNIKHMSPINQLSNNVNDLITKHDKLRHYANRQIGVLEHMFFEKLLIGGYNDENQILDMLKFIDQPKLQPPLMLGIIRFECMESEMSVNEASAVVEYRQKAFAKCLSANKNVFETSMNDCVIIFSCGEYSSDVIENQFKSTVDELYRIISEEPTIHIKAVISVPVYHYIDIGKIYTQCRDIVQRYNNRCTILRQQDIQITRFSYPLDVETQLTNFTLAGNHEKVYELLESIFGQEHLSTHISHSWSMLTLAICETLMRISQTLRVDISDKISEIEDVVISQSILNSRLDEEIFDKVVDAFDFLLKSVANKQHSRTDDLIERIKQYIEKNYADADVTLANTAAHFSLTDSYLSRAFKESTGINFSNYLEKVRIKHVLEMIDTPAPLNSIAAQTGFDHLYNLRSAFKRVIGMTPSEYRKRDH